MLNVAVCFVCFVQTEGSNLHPEDASGSRKEHHLAPGVVILINRLNCHTISVSLFKEQKKANFHTLRSQRRELFLNKPVYIYAKVISLTSTLT